MRGRTGGIWREIAGTVLYGWCVLAVAAYASTTFGLFPVEDRWAEAAAVFGIAALGASGLGAAVGYWRASRVRRRIDELDGCLTAWEKGNFSYPVPAFEDEAFGRLAERLGDIGRIWQEQISSLQRLSSHNAELAEKAKAAAANEERQRLARELHDAVSQQLFAISMTATAARREIERDAERTKRQLELIEEMAAVAQSEMRALLLHLRPVALEGRPLAHGLAALLAELRSKVPMDIAWEFEEPLSLPKGIEDHLFRIAQEALSNALRHSRATRLEVKLFRSGDAVRLLVRDDGVGFDPAAAKPAAYGLATMRERVSEIGGTMQLVTAPGRGTRIDIRVPVLPGTHEEGADRSEIGGYDETD
ncbi:MAG: sensor histidine kinase [Candidatus Reconcilbacillus cellulovorans]|uniref:Sensor histidine kinase n=1 Tax=Candidatus Reconcilbacillus cellulovorans TaxID=1906605 RepID=A0A2A6DY23_9BACL|nr:MAG: sensor histidine kinase [Candidatus Reconcilbacillus cellulovorans]